MKLFKYLVPAFVATLIATNAHAQLGQETGFDRQLRTNDDQSTREFVESKENIDVRQKASNLDISGDVRFFYQNVQEKGVVPYREESSYPSYSSFRENYRAFRGGDHVDRDGVPLSTNIFDVEFNLKIKYSYKKSWAMAHIQFDNPAGTSTVPGCVNRFPVFNHSGSEVLSQGEALTGRRLKGSGIASNINLKRAYIGYNIISDGINRLDIEVGRRKLDDVFDSEIQFSNRFDGLLLKYARAFKGFTDFYWNTAAFVVDQRVNHFGYVTELGLLGIFDSGVDIRYSFIDWRKCGTNRCFYHNPTGAKFANSQISITYTFNPTLCNEEIPVELYSGFLVNHAAKKNRFSKGRKENLGWYAGIYVGNVNKEGDWSIDLEYIAVQAQAVPDADVGSIGRGNIFGEGFVDVVEMVDISEDGSYSNSYFLPRRGNANFMGWRAEYLYALTDNLSVDLVYQWSKAQNRKLGGKHNYQDFEIEIIYAF